MWPKYFFSSDFDEKIFGYDSDDFKKKNVFKVKKKKSMKFVPLTKKKVQKLPNFQERCQLI